MTIQNLKNIDLSQIVDSLVQAFEGYFVKMPDSVEYWDGRFKGARVNYELSFGVFDEGKLVAFIINGIDVHDGKLAAFNTGTGVIKTHRGQQLVDKLYAHALPKLHVAGVEKCMLDVVQANARAIRVYERIGFSIKRNFLCFRGEINVPAQSVNVKRVPFTQLAALSNPVHSFYSWDDTNTAIQTAGEAVYESYIVQNEVGEIIGHFVFNPLNNYVAQLEAKEGHFTDLMNGIRQLSPSIRVNNVDDRRTDYVQQLLASGLENHINQYEMEMLMRDEI